MLSMLLHKEMPFCCSSFRHRFSLYIVPTLTFLCLHIHLSAKPFLGTVLIPIPILLYVAQPPPPHAHIHIQTNMHKCIHTRLNARSFTLSLKRSYCIRTGKCFHMDIFGQGPHTEAIKSYSLKHELPVRNWHPDRIVESLDFIFTGPYTTRLHERQVCWAEMFRQLSLCLQDLWLLHLYEHITHRNATQHSHMALSITPHSLLLFSHSCCFCAHTTYPRMNPLWLAQLCLLLESYFPTHSLSIHSFSIFLVCLFFSNHQTKMIRRIKSFIALLRYASSTSNHFYSATPHYATLQYSIFRQHFTAPKITACSRNTKYS